MMIDVLQHPFICSIDQLLEVVRYHIESAEHLKNEMVLVREVHQCGLILINVCFRFLQSCVHYYHKSMSEFKSR